jgi:alcohol oxidase
MLWTPVSQVTFHDPTEQQPNTSAAGKFRPTEEEVAGLGPDFKAAWDRDFKNAPNRPLMIIAMYLAYFGDHSMLPDDSEYVSMANWTGYPYSRGHIHITGPNVGDTIDFDVGYLKVSFFFFRITKISTE